MNIKPFALSTCGWCRKPVNWLNEKGVDYDLVYSDQLAGDERREMVEELKQYNERKTFPTIVINAGEIVIIGYKPDEMEKELLK